MVRGGGGELPLLGLRDLMGKLEYRERQRLF